MPLRKSALKLLIILAVLPQDSTSRWRYQKGWLHASCAWRADNVVIIMVVGAAFLSLEHHIGYFDLMDVCWAS